MNESSLPKKCHFIGIGGIGMSGLAHLLLQQGGAEVSGSDLASNAMTQSLAQAGAHVHQGHSAALISPDMTVIYSSDIKMDNPEYQAALQLKCPLWHRSDLLQVLLAEKKSLAVAGTHGKTTTTSLLTLVLREGKTDPSFMVGGIPKKLQTNAGFGKGDFFVFEADESDGSFLKYAPFGTIVTNIDLDHMNYFRTEAALFQAFQQFASRAASPDHLFWWGEDLRLQRMELPGNSYGFSSSCAWRLDHFQQHQWTSFFDLTFEGHCYPAIELSLIGRHNALNAAAVFGLALKLGVEEAAIRNALRSFEGVGRRCEKKGEVRGAWLLDDYAHHPTEIHTTLTAIQAALAGKKKRLRAVFQPHRPSRMEHCMGHFANVFDMADEVVVTDLYLAGEKVLPGVTTERIFEEIGKSHARCRYVPREILAETLHRELEPSDVVVSLGAGDITKLSLEILACSHNLSST